MLDQPLLLEPLLRLMPLPATLLRHATVSADRRLRTLKLADTPLARGVNGTFDDSCRLSIAEDMEPDDLKVKLTAHGGKREFSGIHLTVLSTRGQINIALGDDNCRVFVGTDTHVRAAMQLTREATVFIGDQTIIGQSRMFVNNADLVIGQDCHLAEEVLLQCHDQHLYIDLSNAQLLNGGRQRMYVGRHVLINRRALLMPGVRLGDGSIVQAGAVVVNDVQPNSLAGGSPAVLLREQVAWQRHVPTAATAEQSKKSASRKAVAKVRAARSIKRSARG